jgi:hypothetical protein
VLGGTGIDQDILIAILGSPEYYTIVGGDDRAFIERAYNDTVRRIPTPVEVGDAQALVVASATGRTTLARNLVLGREYMSRPIVLSYQRYLGRPPTAAEEDRWLLVLPRAAATSSPPATSIESMEAEILGSPEYFTVAGGTSDGFLTHVFNDILHRTPTPAEAATYATDLAVSGAGAPAARTRIAAAIYASREYRDDVITSTYITTLYTTCPALPELTRCPTTVRHPTPAELDAALRGFTTGASEEDLVAQLVSSDEYYFNHSGGSHEAFIGGVYNDLLDARPTHEQVTAAMAAYGNDRAAHLAYVQHVLQGDEYKAHLVDGWYHQYVLRVPTAAERSEAITRLGGGPGTVGTPDETVIANIMSTDEYYRDAEGADSTFLRHVYGDLMLAVLPAATEATLLAPAPHDTSWRTGAAHSIMGSAEYRTFLISGAYEKYLSRQVCTPVAASSTLAFPGGVFGVFGLVLLLGAAAAGGVFMMRSRGAGGGGGLGEGVAITDGTSIGTGTPAGESLDDKRGEVADDKRGAWPDKYAGGDAGEKWIGGEGASSGEDIKGLNFTEPGE